MNNRQNEILTFLLESKGPFSVNELADKAGCSEKTIRNDLKVIDDWLTRETNLVMIRKPGVGIYIDQSDNGKMEVLQRVKSLNGEEISDTLRKLNIIKMLLLKDGVSTVQEFADYFYVSKTVIRSDFEEIEEWLAKFEMTLLKKQGQGISISGAEKNWRTALAQITQMIIRGAAEERKVIENIFAPGEIVFTKNGLRKLEGDLGFSFTDEALDNLVTHVLISVKRAKQGSKIEFAGDEMSEIEKKDQYRAIQEFVRNLEKAFAIRLPREEIAYITIRVLGSKIYYPATFDPAQMVAELSKLDPQGVSFSKKLISAVSDVSGKPFYNDHHLLIGLAMHMKTTIYRLKYSFAVENPMLREIKKRYFTLFEIIFYVMPAFWEEFQIRMPEDEIAYLTLHFQASSERMGKESLNSKKVLLVCSMGVGMSQLLQTKLERKFHNLVVVGTSSVKDVKKEIIAKEPDLIISTVSFDSGRVPQITVSPFLMLEEERRIMAVLEDPENKKNEINSYPTIRQLVDRNLIFTDLNRDTRPGIIGALADALIEQNYIEPEYKKSVYLREEQSSTVIGCGIAIPHGNPDFVKAAKMAIAVFPEPVQWGKDLVSVVFLLAIDHSNKGLLKDLFKEVSQLMEDELALQKLINKSSTEDVLAFF